LLPDSASVARLAMDEFATAAPENQPDYQI